MKPELVREYASTLDRNDRDGAVRLAVGWLERGECGVVDLYEGALLPGLLPDSCLLGQSEWCLWRDRIRNSITRTVVEACRPFVMRERDARLAEASRSKDAGAAGATSAGARDAAEAAQTLGALVACPQNESSDAAARVYADFLALCGARADFIGTDVPCLDIASASSFMKSRILCLVIDNPYNLTFLREHCDAVRHTRTFIPLILVAGRAVEGNEAAVRDAGAVPVRGFADIARLVGEERGRAPAGLGGGA